MLRGGRFRKFQPYGAEGVVKRPNARCPSCGSLERQRLIALYLERRTSFFTDPLKVLHFAPEPAFHEKFKSLSNLDYISADLISSRAMVKVDITDIPYEEHSFDVILCSHVLEHVQDDRKAMQELYRVLKPGGWALLQIPIQSSREKTYEDPSIVTPEERLKHFGQKDHVRIYGEDYKDRLASAGFTVKVDSPVKELGQLPKNAKRLRELNEDGKYQTYSDFKLNRNPDYNYIQLTEETAVPPHANGPLRHRLSV